MFLTNTEVWAIKDGRNIENFASILICTDAIHYVLRLECVLAEQRFEQLFLLCACAVVGCKYVLFLDLDVAYHFELNL